MASNSQPLNYEEEERLMPARINAVKAVLTDKHGLDVPLECGEFVARCIRSKDGDLEKAIELIIAFHERIVDLHQNWEPKLLPTEYQEFYNSFVFFPLMQRDRQDRRILCSRVHLWNPEKVNFDELMFAYWMIVLHLIKESVEVQRHGFSVILDLSNFTLQHAWAVKHRRLPYLARCLQKGLLGRIKAVHVVFHSKIITAIYAALRPFLKEKLKKRILFHHSLDGLHQHVDPKGLPKNLGGDLEPLSEECIDMNFVKELLLQDDYYKDCTVKTFLV